MLFVDVSSRECDGCAIQLRIRRATGIDAAADRLQRRLRQLESPGV